MPFKNRILHLEDDDSDVLLIHRAIEKAGLEIEIIVASDGPEFQAALAKNGFDLILSDNCIPGFGSVGALNAARALHPNIPFICVSGAWEDKNVESLLAAGVSRCVEKGRPTEIVSALRQTLATINARTETQRIARIQEASARLIRAVQDLSHARDIKSIQEIVRTAARELTGADGATFVLRDGDKCHYVDEDAISPLWKGQKFPMSACVSGWVMEHARPVVLEDIYQDPRVPADAYRPTFVKSLLMVPIRSQSPLGAIGNYWAQHHLADAREIELLQALANTTAVALENVRIYDELEQRVAERTRQLEAANRELESFSFSVSHDLRSPLHSIGAYAELLDDPELHPTDEERHEQLSRIRQLTVRMGSLIEDFLRLGQLSRAEMNKEPVDLSTLAESIAQTLRANNPERVAQIAIAPQLADLGDRRLLQVVMENLLSNAWKYTGRLATPTRIEFGSLPAAKPTQPTTYFVRDNGAGFDPQYAGKLFAPFQRLHSPKDFPGSGVGLATVQRIIHKHGGRIWAESKPGAGATFFFTLRSEA